MSQADLGNLESPLSGDEFINDKLEPWRTALHTTHSGTSRPSYVAAGMIWLDINTTPWVLNLFDGSQDIPLFTIDISSNIASPSGITITTFMKTLLDDTDATAARATLGLVIGSNVQAFNAILTLIAGLTAAANKGVYFTSDSAMATFDLTAFGRSLLDDADAAAARTTLGITPSGLVLLEAKTVSGVSTVEFTSGLDSTYEEYEIHFQDVIPATNNTTIYMRTSSNGGVSFDASSGNYSYTGMRSNSTGSTIEAYNSSGDDKMEIFSGAGNSSDRGVHGSVKIFNPANNAINKIFEMRAQGVEQDNSLRQHTQSACRKSTAIINAVRFLAATGNISGKFKLYGVQKA